MVGHLKRYGCAFGVDLDHEAVGYCLGRGLDTVSQASAEQLPFEDGTFDAVTMLDVLEHIADDGAALAEAARVVRPGGALMVAVPAYGFLWGAQDEVSQHQRRYTARQLGARMRGAGLNVTRLSYFNSLLFPPIAAIRLARRAVPWRGTERSDFNFPAPGPMNRLLAVILGSEASAVVRVGLPFGVSIVCLGVKPAVA